MVEPGRRDTNPPTDTNNNIASPVSTGGAGPDFERRVGAYYLAAALLGGIPRGLNAGVAREVRFQRLYQGDPLDDLIVVADLPAGDVKLALQLKRDLVFGEKDEKFNEVIGACWQTFTSPAFNPSTDRFGVCLALYSKKVDEYYQSVLAWARASATAADFLERISTRRLANESQRSFLRLIRERLDAHAGRLVTDDEIWNFLRSMVILRFDLSIEGSSDYTHAVQVLEFLLPPEHRTRASSLFDKLEDYAAEGHQTAGSFNAEGLRQKLVMDGFPLLPAPDCRGDLARLREHAFLILAGIRADIGGLTLNRSDVIAESTRALHDAQLLELIGPPGTGKSAVLRALAENQAGQGPLFALSWERLEGAGWNSFASSLRLQQPLREILTAMSGSSQPCLFIDGPDRIASSGARQIVLDILRTIGQVSGGADGSRRWKVVITLREENTRELRAWLDLRLVGRPVTVRIPELTPEEIQLVAEKHPRLQPLLNQDRVRPILSNPFMLDLLSDPRMVTDAGEVPSSVATEVEVQKVWWERIVGSDVSNVDGRSRQLALLKLGQVDARSPGQRLLAEDVEGGILHSLERDRILVRDPDRDIHKFGHDLIEDWVLFRTLNRRREELADVLREFEQPFGLLRAVQLVGCSALEDDAADAWNNLLLTIELATDLAPRWRQAIYTGPLLSTRAGELLNKSMPLLLTDDGRRLIELLIVLRTSEVNPDYALMPVLTEALKNYDFVSPVLLDAPVPRFSTWLPVIGWLIRQADILPRAARGETSRIFELWQRHSPPGSPYRKEVGEIVLAWLNEVDEWQ